jgi:hypothetical protein
MRKAPIQINGKVSLPKIDDRTSLGSGGSQLSRGMRTAKTGNPTGTGSASSTPLSHKRRLFT